MVAGIIYTGFIALLSMELLEISRGNFCSGINRGSQSGVKIGIGNRNDCPDFDIVFDTDTDADTDTRWKQHFRV
jgi:hypothetical protein